MLCTTGSITHIFNLEETLDFIAENKLKIVFNTYKSSDGTLCKVNPTLPPGVLLAYDSIKIAFTY